MLLTWCICTWRRSRSRISKVLQHPVDGEVHGEERDEGQQQVDSEVHPVDVNLKEDKNVIFVAEEFCLSLNVSEVGLV